MKKISLTIIFTMVCLVLFGQDKPLWLDADFRDLQYPKSTFLTGYAEGNINAGENYENAVSRIKTAAQTALLENIRVTMKSNTRSEMGSVSSSAGYDEYETLISKSEKSAAAEITGMKTESYFDKATKYIYAFAYANRYELIGYYKANLSLQIQQAENALKTVESLVANGEKSRARKECDAAMPLFGKIRFAQDLLTVLENSANIETLKVNEAEELYNRLIQWHAQLEQGTYIYVESAEDLFGESVDILANKLKAELAVNGCSFVDDVAKADFKLVINAKTRESSTVNNMVFCYADIAVALYDNHKQKTVFADELSEKGGSSSLNKAARKAMENAVSKIAEKLKSLIK